MTREEMIPHLKTGTVIRFQVKRHTGYDAASDTDDYEITHHQGVITQAVCNRDRLRFISAMYLTPCDLLPRVESVDFDKITHVLVEVN